MQEGKTDLGDAPDEALGLVRLDVRLDECLGGVDVLSDRLLPARQKSTISSSFMLGLRRRKGALERTTGRACPPSTP